MCGGVGRCTAFAKAILEQSQSGAQGQMSQWGCGFFWAGGEIEIQGYWHHL
jgi:hypothetical protein